MSWLTNCLHWPFCPGVFIAMLALLASAVTYIENPGRRLKVIIILSFTMIMCLEIWMMSKDRDQHDSEQRQAAQDQANRFQNIADQITESMQQNKQDFDVTMGRFQAQALSLTKLQHGSSFLSKQVSLIPLTDLSVTELVERGKGAAKQMRAYLASYQYADHELDLRYYDYYEGNSNKMSPEQAKSWLDQEARKRAELRKQYEASAVTTIDAANRIRVELLKRLPPGDRFDRDNGMRKWFEDPTPDPVSGTFLYKLDEGANYLEQLTDRLAQRQVSQ